MIGGNNTRDSYVIEQCFPGFLLGVTFSVSSLYYRMDASGKYTKWTEPGLNLFMAVLVSLVTALIAFRSAELDQQILITFFSYYLILGIMSIMFRIRSSIINPNTAQLLHFSYILLGFVLSTVGMIGMFSGNIGMAIVFILVLLLPGLSCIRAGLKFKKAGA